MLVTDTEILNWIGIPAGTDADAKIVLINPMVTADCCRYIDRQLEQATATERYTGQGGPILQLKRWPIISITSLKILGGAALVQGWDKDYVFEQMTGQVTLTQSAFPATPPQAIEITYKAGYTTGVPNTGELLCPADLKMSLCKAAAFQFFAQDKRRTGIDTVSTADQSVTYVQGEYPRDVLNVWKRHRRMNVG